MESLRPDRSQVQMRQHERYAVSWVATVQSASGQSMPAMVIDVSQNGIAVLADAKLAEEHLHDLMVTVPVPSDGAESTTINLLARVIDQVPAGRLHRVGLAFAHIAAMDVVRLVECAQRRA
jgi:hypothetical protein